MYILNIFKFIQKIVNKYLTRNAMINLEISRILRLRKIPKQLYKRKKENLEKITTETQKEREKNGY